MTERIDRDVVVVGSGFGGLGAAITAAERGAAVTLCEAVTYPGGCAATFQRKGVRHDAGATLMAGLGEDQLFGRWLGRHGVELPMTPMDPVLTLRTPDAVVPLHADRDTFVAALATQCGPHGAAVRRALARQRSVADALWGLFDDPDLLPPWTPTALWTHLGRSPRYLPLAGLVGRSVDQVLRRDGALDARPLRHLLHAMAQITVQVGADEAEAPFAYGALDVFWRGVRHLRGGPGTLARGLVTALERAGGEARFAERVVALRRDGSAWEVHTRKAVFRAPVVLANLLPGDLPGLVDQADRPTLDRRRLDRMNAAVHTGWGAVMRYLVLRRDAPLPPHGFHLELVHRPDDPLPGGNHALVSVSAADDTTRHPDGHRVATVSTHIALPTDPARIEGVRAALRTTVSALAPEIDDALVAELPASPRTFTRFTRRGGGYVGGVPRRAGLHHYTDLFPRPVGPGLWLVGDTVFPGQSTLAVAVGGHRAATAALR